jgi:hypothetical protein
MYAIGIYASLSRLTIPAATNEAIYIFYMYID